MHLCCHAESFLTAAPVEVLLSQGCMQWMFLAQWETSHYLRGSPVAHLKWESTSIPQRTHLILPLLSCSCLLLAFAIVKMSSISIPASAISPCLFCARSICSESCHREERCLERCCCLAEISVFLFNKLQTEWLCIEYQANFFVVLMITKLVLPCTFLYLLCLDMKTNIIACPRSFTLLFAAFFITECEKLINYSHHCESIFHPAQWIIE